MNVDRIKLCSAVLSRRIEVVRGFANAIEARDEYTRFHSSRVAELSRKIGRKLDLPHRSIDILYAAATVHDVGKIGIPESILNKPAPLTSREYKVIATHPIIGAAILKPIAALKSLVPVVYHHHERFDGRGYPNALKGEEIPLLSRIISVADSFEAMTSHRCYRSRLAVEDALMELKANSGAQFDPGVIDAFMDLHSSGDYGEDAVVIDYSI